MIWVAIWMMFAGCGGHDMTAVQLVAHLSALGYEASVYIKPEIIEWPESGVYVRWREATEEGSPAYQAQLEADAGMSVDYAEWVLADPDPAGIDFYFFTADLGLMPLQVHHYRMRRRP